MDLRLASAHCASWWLADASWLRLAYKFSKTHRGFRLSLFVIFIEKCGGMVRRVDFYDEGRGFDSHVDYVSF